MEESTLIGMTETDFNSQFTVGGEGSQQKQHKSRVIDVPVNSNLVFQQVIYYNFYYAFLHAFFLFAIGSYKMYMFRVRGYREFLNFFFIIVYLPIEMTILYFGYVGNIKETFPEMIAFMTFIVFFKIPIQVGIYFQAFLFPLEKSCFWIIGGFIFLELFYGTKTIIRVIKTQTAAFYLRNAPLIDPRFAKQYQSRGIVKSSREIALGLKKHKGETEADDKYLEPISVK